MATLPLQIQLPLVSDIIVQQDIGSGLINFVTISNVTIINGLVGFSHTCNGITVVADSLSTCGYTSQDSYRFGIANIVVDSFVLVFDTSIVGSYSSNAPISSYVVQMPTRSISDVSYTHDYAFNYHNLFSFYRFSFENVDSQIADYLSLEIDATLGHANGQLAHFLDRYNNILFNFDFNYVFEGVYYEDENFALTFSDAQFCVLFKNKYFLESLDVGPSGSISLLSSYDNWPASYLRNLLASIPAPVDLSPVLLSLANIDTKLNSLNVSVDLTPITNELPKIQSTFYTLNDVDAAIKRMEPKLETIDIQIPADLPQKISEIIAHLPANITPLDITNLDGNFCKYKTGQQVEFSTYGIYTVAKAELCIVDENVITPVYTIVKDGKYSQAPQAMLKAYTAPAPAPVV